MKSSLHKNGAAGFTLIELMVMIAIILLFSIVGFPAFSIWIDKARVMAVVHSTTARMQVARQEAIMTNSQVVVQPDLVNDEIVYFVNVDQDAGFEFNPDSTAPFKTADYELGRQRLPLDYHIEFWAATDQRPKGRDAIEGFTPTAAPTNAVIFRPDGSVMDAGAIRLADDRGNFFEVRIGLPATGTPRVKKYHPNPPWGGRGAFFPRGRHLDTGDPLWQWF